MHSCGHHPARGSGSSGSSSSAGSRPPRAAAPSPAATARPLLHRPRPLLLLLRSRPAPAAAAAATPAAPKEQAQQQQEAPTTTNNTNTTKIAGLTVRPAASAAELRAAAYLRAASFGHYPADRSEYAARQHRRMRGDAEWEAVTAKVEGREPAYASMRVACLIATAPVPSPFAAGEEGGSSSDDDNTNAALAARLAQEAEVEGSAALLPSADGGRGTVEAVVGTLDVNVGAVLPAEELVGRRGRVGAAAGGGGGSSGNTQPPPPPPSTRAYLSNVCVAKAARGQGVGKALLRAAEAMVVRPEEEEEGLLRRVLPAAGGGDDNNENDDDDDDRAFHLYVHVVHDNAAARALYQGPGGGFSVEAEEGEAFARGLARPRRLLLHKALPLPPL